MPGALTVLFGRKLTARADPSPMTKFIILVLAIGVALWGTGVDLVSIKQEMTGTASAGARSLTGKQDDWG
jgi:hypothetical protein